MLKAAVLLLCVFILVIAATARAGVTDIRGGDAVERTWSVGFWEFGVGSFDTVRLDWVSGQVLSPPYLKSLDTDGIYGKPYTSDGWGVVSGDPHTTVLYCVNPSAWLGFDAEFAAPEGPTCWQVRVYDGTTLKDLELVTYDGTSWRFQPMGACCAQDGSCSVLTAADCAETQGAWLGNAASCSATGCQQTPVEKTSWGKIKSLYR
jgi:hypothetical protein